MDSHREEVKQIASNLLAAMLSNPHIYAQTKVEGGDGQMEQKLIILSAEMAESLIQYIEENHQHPTEQELLAQK